MRNSVIEQLDKVEVIKTARKYEISAKSIKALVFTLLDKGFTPSEILYMLPNLNKRTVLLYRNDWERYQK